MAPVKHFANWICGKRILTHAILHKFFVTWTANGCGLKREALTRQSTCLCLRSCKCLLPPTEEQEKIADIGASFDRRLERERDALAILIETRAALAQELLSGRLRLPESIVARYRAVPAAAA